MKEQQKAEPKNINVFEELDALSKEETEAIVRVMILPSDERIEKLEQLEDPADVGVYYAVYGRYIASRKPYAPTDEDLAEIIGAKISLMADAIEDGLSGAYLWALDSSLLTDITQLTLQEEVNGELAQMEKDEKKVKSYDH